MAVVVVSTLSVCLRLCETSAQYGQRTRQQPNRCSRCVYVISAQRRSGSSRHNNVLTCTTQRLTHTHISRRVRRHGPFDALYWKFVCTVILLVNVINDHLSRHMYACIRTYVNAYVSESAYNLHQTRFSGAHRTGSIFRDTYKHIGGLHIKLPTPTRTLTRAPFEISHSK